MVPPDDDVLWVGGYCVFAGVATSDSASFAVVDKIAVAIGSKAKQTVKIKSAKLQD